MYTIEQQWIYVEQIMNPEHKQHWRPLLRTIIEYKFDIAIIKQYLEFLYTDHHQEFPHLGIGIMDSDHYDPISSSHYSNDMIELITDLHRIKYRTDEFDNGMWVFVEMAIEHVLEELSPDYEFGVIFAELIRLRYQIKSEPYVITDDMVCMVAATFYHNDADTPSTRRVFKSLKDNAYITSSAFNKLMNMVFEMEYAVPSLSIYEVFMLWVHRSNHYADDIRSELFDMIVRHKNKMVLMGKYDES